MEPDVAAETQARWPVWLRWTGRVTAAVVSGGLNAIAGLCVVFLWIAWLSGDYRTDHDMLENGGIWLTFTAMVGGGSAVVSFVVAAVAVKLRWMPRWTIFVPAVLLVATLFGYAVTSTG